MSKILHYNFIPDLELHCNGMLTYPFQGENINIAWAPNGKTIAVGNKEDLVTFIDVRSHKIQREEQFKFEVLCGHSSTKN